jgi:hypothetical protein
MEMATPATRLEICLEPEQLECLEHPLKLFKSHVYQPGEPVESFAQERRVRRPGHQQRHRCPGVQAERSGEADRLALEQKDRQRPDRRYGQHPRLRLMESTGLATDAIGDGPLVRRYLRSCQLPSPERLGDEQRVRVLVREPGTRGLALHPRCDRSLSASASGDVQCLELRQVPTARVPGIS